MQLYTIICETNDLNELNLGLTKKGRDLKRANKATKGSLKDEVRNLEIELLTYMKNSGNSKATPEFVKKYLGQKGLSKVGNPVVDAVVAKATPQGAVGMDNPRQEPPVTGGGAPNAAPNATPNNAPPVGSPAAPKPIAKNTVVKGADGNEYKWLGNAWRNSTTGRMASRAQRAELDKLARQQNNSMYEAANQLTLSKRQVRNILRQVVTKAYGDKAGFTKSKFGTDSSNDQNTQAMISALQDQGYKVTK